MIPSRLALLCPLVAMACRPATTSEPDLAASAEQFFRGVYECAGADLGAVANPDVRVSYPIFAERLGTPVLEGLRAVEDFAASFCEHWSDPVVVVHDVIRGERRVALVWSYSAVPRGEGSEEAARVAWGGISVFRFDDQGQVVAELGEESTPGPVARMAGGADAAGRDSVRR